MRRPSILLLLLLSSFLSSLPAVSAEEKDRLVRTTEPLRPEDQIKGFKIPEGFSIQLFADETLLGGKPINMAFDARGRLWVSSTQEYPYAVPKNRWSDPQGRRAKDSKDTIRILEDTDGDGRADKVTVFADEMNIPTGVLPYKNGCIAYSIPNLWFLEDTDRDGKCDKRKILFGPLGWEKDTHGMVSSLRLGLDGWVYATHGFSNTSHFEVRPENRILTADGADHHKQAGEADRKPSVQSAKSAVKESGLSLDITSGSVFRFKPDGSRVEPWTAGQVNPFGLCWDSWGNLYSADCHSNPITQLIRGACYPSFGKPHDGIGFAPVMCTHAHGSTGLCGVIYLDEGVWGPEWDHHMFVGNCVTSRIDHDHITFTGSTPKANEAPDFLVCDDPWFRPVDLQLGPDSALYVADFYNSIIGHYEVPLDHPKRDRGRGRIWRVVREGFTGKLTECDLTKRSDGEALAAMVRHPSRVWRATAGLEFESRHVSQENMNRLMDGSVDLSDPKRGRDGGPFHLRRALEWALDEPSIELVQTLVGELSKTNPEDTHATHSIRVSLAALLRLPGGYAELKKSPLTPACRLDLMRISTAVASPEAANWLFDCLKADEVSRKESRPAIAGQKGGDDWKSPLLGDRALVTSCVTHVARHLPADRDGEIVVLVQQHLGSDLDTQLDLFSAIREGRQAAKARPTPVVMSWSAELTGRLLAALQSEPADTWRPLTPPTDAHPNPWRSATRKCADGTQRSFLDSHVAAGSEKHTGTLRSARFLLPAQLTFWIAGHRGFPTGNPHEKTFVRLVSAETGEELARAYPPRNDTAQKITWDFVSKKLGRQRTEQVVLEVVDDDNATAYAWLAAGGFEPAVATIPSDPQQRDKRLRMLAQLVRSGVDSPKAVQRLVSLKDKPSFTPDTREELAAFLADRADATLKPLVPMARDTELAPAIFDTLQAPGSSDEQLAKAFRTLPFRSQAKLATALAGSVDGANRLLKLASPAVFAEPLVSTKLKALKDASIDERVQSITATLPPQNEALNKLIGQRLKAFDTAKTDVKRGEEVFNTACFICHRIGVRGNLVGPQLDGIGARGAERLLEDILDPNRAVDPAFRLHIVKRKDGSLYAGLLRREEEEAITFADATAQETRILKADITANDESPLSLMPPGLGEALTEQQLHDLLAYLLARK
jgi:putative membrane-bound dehydrogenase-like protein